MDETANSQDSVSISSRLGSGDDDAARTEQNNDDTKQLVHDRLTISVNGAIQMLELALAVI